MDLTAIRTALKLSEGTSDEAVLEAALAKLAEVPVAPAPEADDVAKLAEGNPVIARLLAENAERERRLAEMETAIRLSEVRTALHDVDADTTLAITPAAKSLAEPLLVKLPTKERGELVALLRQFSEGTGIVKLGETGGTSPAARAEGNADAVKQFTDLVASIEKEDKVPFREALRRAQLQNPVLHEQYRKETTAFTLISSAGGEG